jgi:hypothetical protein
VFDSPDAAAKREAIAGLGSAAVEAYLTGSLAFAEGDLDEARGALARAAAELPPTHARVRSELALAAAAAQLGEEAKAASRAAAATAVAGHLQDEFQRLAADPLTVQSVLASQLFLTGWEPLPGPGLVRQARAKLGRRARF